MIPHLVDVAILALVAEAAGIAVYRRRTGGGPGLGRIAPNLASGGLILVALRFATAQAAWPWILAPLALSLLAHVVDLRARWHRDG